MPTANGLTLADFVDLFDTADIVELLIICAKEPIRQKNTSIKYHTFLIIVSYNKDDPLDPYAPDPTKTGSLIEVNIFIQASKKGPPIKIKYPTNDENKNKIKNALILLALTIRTSIKKNNNKMHEKRAKVV